MKASRYAILQLSFTIGGESFHRSAYVSAYGALRVLPYDETTNVHGDLTGKVIRVGIGARYFEMYFAREFDRDGRVYHLKFARLDPDRRAFLSELIQHGAVAEPWKRRHARLDAISHEEKTPVPSLAVVRLQNAMEVFRVLNFTFGGCLLETSNPSFAPTRLGAPVGFDLMISNGEEMAGIEGRIARVAFERLPDTDHRILSLGVEIQSMNDEDFAKYRYLIRTYCEVLKG